MKRKITTVLFDLDGTLLDTAPDLAAALNIVLQQYNRPVIAFNKIRPLSSTGSKGLLNLGFQIDENHPEYKNLRDQFIDAYHQHISKQTEIFPGMELVLQQLEAQGLRWGVVTNKPAYLAVQLLKDFNLMQRAACIIGGDTVATRKPDPESLLHACEIIGCSAWECVYIGDAERDIEAAKRANMISIAALYGYINNETDDPKAWAADHYVTHPEQIITWLADNFSLS